MQLSREQGPTIHGDGGCHTCWRRARREVQACGLSDAVHWAALQPDAGQQVASAPANGVQLLQLSWSKVKDTLGLAPAQHTPAAKELEPPHKLPAASSLVLLPV
jgi:hypothetical protein